MAQELIEQYLISDAARQVEVETHVLRYWEEELKLPIQRNKLGHRYYTKEDVERFRIIKRWKEQGLQLKAIRNALKDPKGSIWSMMQTELEQAKEEQTEAKEAKKEQIEAKEAKKEQAEVKEAKKEQAEQKAAKQKETVQKGTVQEQTVQEQVSQEINEQAEKTTDNKTVLQENGKGDENKMDSKENSADTQTASEESSEETKREQYIRRSAAKGRGRRAKKNRQKVSVVKWDSKRAEAALEKLDLKKQPDTEQEDIIHMADVTPEVADSAKEAVDETQVTETKAERVNVEEAEQAKVQLQETEQAENQKEQQTEAGESTGQETALSGDTVRTAEILAEEEKDRKAARFQFLLSQMMKEAVRSNNEDLIASVQELVAKEMDFQFRQQEEREQEREEQRLKREEEHFKKIDALLRTRSEQASERKKKRPLFGWS